MRIELDRILYSVGLMRGDGAALEVGQSSVKPAGSCGSGTTRKLRFETAL